MRRQVNLRAAAGHSDDSDKADVKVRRALLFLRGWSSGKIRCLLPISKRGRVFQSRRGGTEHKKNGSSCRRSSASPVGSFMNAGVSTVSNGSAAASAVRRVPDLLWWNSAALLFAVMQPDFPAVIETSGQLRLSVTFFRRSDSTAATFRMSRPFNIYGLPNATLLLEPVYQETRVHLTYKHAFLQTAQRRNVLAVKLGQKVRSQL